MAQLARLLKTDPLSDLRAAGEALRKKGRGRDTMLAHITPREAAKLKKEGGSGTINPKTGLLEFDDSGAIFADFGAPSIDYSASVTPQQAPVSIDYQPTPNYSLDTSGGNAAYGDLSGVSMSPGGVTPGLMPSIQDNLGAAGDAIQTAYGYTAPSNFGSSQAQAYAPTFTGQPQDVATPPQPSSVTPDAAGVNMAGTTPATATQDPGFLSKLGSSLTADPTKALIAALGVGGMGLSYLTAQNQAKKNASAIQNAYAQAAASQKSLAQPFIQQGGTELAQALNGQLSAAQQQQLQAAQAQANQNMAGAGGVGAQQAERSLEDLRQRLLSQQQQLALSLFGAGTPLIQSAIQDQLQGTVAGISAANQGSAAAGQAATGLLSMLAFLYGSSSKKAA